jgi:hypothetical protein
VVCCVICSRSQYTLSLLCQLFLRPHRVHNNTTKSLIPYREHGSPGVTQSLIPSALYSRPSSNAGLGEEMIAKLGEAALRTHRVGKAGLHEGRRLSLQTHIFLDMKNLHILLVADVTRRHAITRPRLFKFFNFRQIVYPCIYLFSNAFS